jgi:hypothetical protein
MRTPAKVPRAIFIFCFWLASLLTGEESKAQRAGAISNDGFDPSRALESRIGEPPPVVLKQFKDAGFTPTAHVLTAVERQKVINAFAALPPLNQRIL